MTCLTKKNIFDTNDIEIKRVDVPEWGGYVYVKNITAKQRDRFEVSFVENRNKGLENINARGHLVAISTCDKDGKLLFNLADIDKLGQKSGKALDRIFEVSQKMNGLDYEAVKVKRKN